jgi:hypothetical protein
VGELIPFINQIKSDNYVQIKIEIPTRYMNDKEAYILGTSIKITALLNIDTATTAKITIQNSTEVILINEVDMTKEVNRVYSYVYQSGEDDDEGEYIATVEITYGGYTSVAQEKFNLLDRDTVWRRPYPYI